MVTENKNMKLARAMKNHLHVLKKLDAVQSQISSYLETHTGDDASASELASLMGICLQLSEKEEKCRSKCMFLKFKCKAIIEDRSFENQYLRAWFNHLLKEELHLKQVDEWRSMNNL